MIEKLIPALSAIGGAAVGFLFSMLKDWIQRKADSREKFFYEVYPKRLAIYEDVVKELMGMGKNDGPLLDITLAKEYILKEIEDYLHTLDGLRSRLDLYGSPAARNIIAILRVEMSDHFRAAALEPDNFVHECVALCNVIKDTCNQFLEFIRKEAGADLVDKEIVKFFDRDSVATKAGKQKIRKSPKKDKSEGN